MNSTFGLPSTESLSAPWSEANGISSSSSSVSNVAFMAVIVLPPVSLRFSFRAQSGSIDSSVVPVRVLETYSTRMRKPCARVSERSTGARPKGGLIPRELRALPHMGTRLHHEDSAETPYIERRYLDSGSQRVIVTECQTENTQKTEQPFTPLFSHRGTEPQSGVGCVNLRPMNLVSACALLRERRYP